MSGSNKSKFLNYYVFVFIIIQSNLLYSQENVAINKQIDSCFTVLNNSNYSYSASCPVKEYYPFYFAFNYLEFLTDEKIKSGGTCFEYMQSCKLQLLKEIHILFSSSASSYLHNIIDSEGVRIYDRLRKNCGGPKQIGNITNLNEQEVISIIESYNKWYQLSKKSSYSNLLNTKTYPTFFSKYKWVKEIGYISERKSNNELLQIFENILNDSTYQDYFIKTQTLKKFFKNNASELEILSELMLLSLINNEDSFTDNILKFTITSNTSDDNRKNCIQIMDEILNLKKMDLNSYQVAELVNKHGLVVALRP